MIDEFGNDIKGANKIIVYTCKCKKAIFLEYRKNRKVVCSICKSNIYLFHPGPEHGKCTICDGELFKSRTVKLKGD